MIIRQHAGKPFDDPTHFKSIRCRFHETSCQIMPAWRLVEDSASAGRHANEKTFSCELRHWRDRSLNAIHKPVHTYFTGGAVSKVERADGSGIDTLQILIGQGYSIRHNGLTGIVLDRALENIFPREFASQHIGKFGFHLVDHFGGHTRLGLLTFHEAIETHDTRVGIEIIVTGLPGTGLDLL